LEISLFNQTLIKEEKCKGFNTGDELFEKHKEILESNVEVE
jgi:hypothetical protein